MQLQQAVLGALASPAVNPGHHFNAKMSNISVPQYVLDYGEFKLLCSTDVQHYSHNFSLTAT